MNRREFLKAAGLAAGGSVALGGSNSAAPISTYSSPFHTRHVIWIVNGNGARKRDWCQNQELSPNLARLAREGFVYQHSRNETVANHANAWAELISGVAVADGIVRHPDVLQYVRKAYEDDASRYWLINGAGSYRRWCHAETRCGEVTPGYGEATMPLSLTASQPDLALVRPRLSPAQGKQLAEFFGDTQRGRADFGLSQAPIPRDPFLGDAMGFALVPEILNAFKPRLIVLHQVGHDAGHGSGDFLRKQDGFLEYQKVCRTTDEQLGRIADFVRRDPYFSKTTAIVVRPEFGRDDEVNRYGELNHSFGYPETCDSAEIWWGPDFRTGVESTQVDRADFAPSLVRLFNVDATYAHGKAHTEMFSPALDR